MLRLVDNIVSQECSFAIRDNFRVRDLFHDRK